ncbi:MAG: TIGR02285 family protein [Desulfobulbus sp.]|nr:TIGR02285 family protein [Desulfobulbus sp.]
MPKAALSAFVLCIGLLLLTAPQRGWTKDNLIWMEAVLPPFFIQSGPNVEQGYGDAITHVLQQHMPGYNHEEINTNITRHFYMFKQGDQVCSVGLYKTPEREEFMYFSMPSFITLPPVIIIKKDNIAKFNNKTTVSLDAVLADGNLMIGLAKDRSYGNTLDDVFSRHQGQANLVEFTGQELSHNLFKMLMLGRLDGLIGLPEEALYQAEQMGIRDQFLTLTLSENLHNYDGWMSCVACSKTPWGKNVIDSVNQVLLEQRPTEQYRAAYERWLDPNSIAAYRRAYAEVFLQTTH